MSTEAMRTKEEQVAWVALQRAKNKLYDTNSRISSIEYQALRTHGASKLAVLENDLIQARGESVALQERVKIAEREYRKAQAQRRKIETARPKEVNDFSAWLPVSEDD